MANALLKNDTRAFEQGLVLLGGVVKIKSDATVDATLTKIKGVLSVVRTGAGTYRVTLRHKWNGLVSGQLTLLAATGVDLVPQLKAVDVINAKTIDFVLNTGATATDPAAACELHLALWLKNSSV